MKASILLTVLVIMSVGYKHSVHGANHNQKYRRNYHQEDDDYGDYDGPEPRFVEKCELTARPPNPETQCCGVDSLNSVRVVGGTQALPQQYPWLGLIEYRKKNKTLTLCGAALISGRYVLTAAHCVMGEVLDHGKPIRVRLGDHNSTHEGPDCVTVKDTKVCNHGALRIPIESIIFHKDHVHNNVTNVHDIALIRLKENVPHTEFIRPICLPSVDIAVNPPKNVSLYVAGWGAKAQTRIFELGRWTFRNTYSDVKLHVDLPLANIEDCQETYSFVNTKNHICAGGVDGKDACRGDSGGPLMSESGGIYEVAGLVSFGGQKCGSPGKPAVYTNVYQYLDWIHSNIKP